MNDIFPVKNMEVEGDKKTMRDKIMRLENEMRNYPPLIIEPVHRFAKGLYAREVSLKKDTLVTGKIHKQEHITIISQGEVSVLTDEGVKRVKAPFTIITKPGTKNCVYVHEDAVWTTIHATEETDIEKIETIVLASDFEEIDHLLSKETIKKEIEVTSCLT